MLTIAVIMPGTAKVQTGESEMEEVVKPFRSTYISDLFASRDPHAKLFVRSQVLDAVLSPPVTVSHDIDCREVLYRHQKRRPNDASAPDARPVTNHDAILQTHALVHEVL
jgi:hypothetical protein